MRWQDGQKNRDHSERTEHINSSGMQATPEKEAVTPDVELPPGLLQRLRARTTGRHQSTTSDRQPDLAALTAAVKSTDWSERATAVQALGQLGERAPMDLLAQAIQDEHEAVRANAARALGACREHAPLGHLLLALHDANWHVRATAAQALGKLGKRVPVGPLIKMLADEDESVRAAATGALGQIGDPVAIKALQIALRDPAWHVREMAVQALGRFGTDAPAEDLAVALKDRDLLVREAVEALHETQPRLFRAILVARRKAVISAASYQPESALQENSSGHTLQDQLKTAFSTFASLPAILFRANYPRRGISYHVRSLLLYGWCLILGYLGGYIWYLSRLPDAQRPADLPALFSALTTQNATESDWRHRWFILGLILLLMGTLWAVFDRWRERRFLKRKQDKRSTSLETNQAMLKQHYASSPGTAEFLLPHAQLVVQDHEQRGRSPFKSNLREAGKANQLFSHLTLTAWQVRRDWHLLFMMAAGMAAAVMLVCSILLYSRIALSAGLRNELSNNPDSSYLAIHSSSIPLNGSSVQEQTRAYNREIQQHLNGLLSYPLNPEVIVQTAAYPLHNRSAEVFLRGYDMRQASQHIQVNQGTLPGPDHHYQTLEIALPIKVAEQLHATVGTEFSIVIQVVQSSTVREFTLPLRVVGLITANATTDMFWQRSNFEFTNSYSDNPGAPSFFYAMTDDNALLDMLSIYLQMQQPSDLPVLASQTKTDPESTGAVIQGTWVWFYHLDYSHVDIEQLDQLSNDAQILQKQLHTTGGPLESMRRYQNQIRAVYPATVIMLGLVTGLLLLFINVISRLLAENRSATIAILRSRGASRYQIFVMFIAHHTILGLTALCCGPLFAPLIVSLLARVTLSISDQGALNLLTEQSAKIIGSLFCYSMLTALVTIIVGILAVQRIVRLDVISLRRRDGETGPAPLWQRFHLDALIVMLAICGYAIALYEGNVTALDNPIRELVVSPLILVTASCILGAGVLLMIRLFPWLLKCSTWLAKRSRSALPTLVFARQNNLSHQAMSSTLLLTLTTAFAVFTLLFISTQINHVADIAAYMAGADFSGSIDGYALRSQGLISDSIAEGQAINVRQSTHFYQDLPGVTAASTGYVTTLYSQGRPITLKAVDPDTFAQSSLWNELDGDSPALQMQLLRNERAAGSVQGYVPAIIDAQTWEHLALSPGQPFTLMDSTDPIASNHTSIVFMATSKVSSTPIVNSNVDASTAENDNILVDYTTFATIYLEQVKLTQHKQQLFPRPNYFWLRTSDDPLSLTILRARLKQLSMGPLTPFYDRRAILEMLYHDPLYLNMLGTLALGAIIPLVLAVMGSLIGTALSIRRRRLDFAVLRALGTAPRQILLLLTWEQVPFYLFLLLIGIVGGWLLSALTIPALTFSSLMPHFAEQVSNQAKINLFSLNNLPAIHLTLPPGVVIALVALVAVCLISLAMVLGGMGWFTRTNPLAREYKE